MKLFGNDPIVRTRQTSWVCPSQWDAWTASGLYVYLRYRWGRGSVDVFYDSSKGTEVATFQHGNDMDGYISLDDFARRAGITIAPDASHE